MFEKRKQNIFHFLLSRKVIFGVIRCTAMGVLRILVYDFQQTASSTLRILLQPIFLQVFLLTVNLKVAFLNFEI